MPDTGTNHPPPIRREHLTANSRKSREQAEISFGKLQTQSLASSRLMSEQDALTIARNAKTARLREQRLEKEAQDLAAAAAAPEKKAKR